MSKYQKMAGLVFLALHLGLILHFNLFALNSYQRKEVFEQLSPSGQAVYTFIKKLLPAQFPSTLAPYGHLAGIDTGYGLFAPNVPSSVSAAFELVDDAGHSRASLPQLSTREGMDRFNVNFNTFKDFEEIRPLLAYGWAIRMLELNPECHKINVVIGSHVLPSMYDFQQGERSRFIESVRYEFELNAENQD